MIATVLAAMGLQAMFGGGGAAAQDGDQTDQRLVERGAAIFGADCATCHGENGRGIDRADSPNAYGPSLVGVGPASFDFMLRTGRMPLERPDTRLRHQPQKVTDDARRALVAWSRTLPGNGPEIPDVDGWETGDLAHGLELFTSNCAACHGPTAAGIAVGQRDFSSDLGVATPLEIAEAVRTGPGVMPVFGDDAFDQQDLEAVVRWVMNLRERAAPGGAQVGRAGPVSEGFVAWVLGIGLLVIVMYLLGEKAKGNDDVDA